MHKNRLRKIWLACKAVAVCALAALCAFFALLLTHSPVFEEGEAYELSYGLSSSAQTVRTKNPLFDKLLNGAVAGESVRYTGNRYEEMKEKFAATLLFTEEVNGVTNYYLYSPLLKGGMELCGRFVNLHIAVSSEQTAAGTPIIFGGF